MQGENWARPQKSAQKHTTIGHCLFPDYLFLMTMVQQFELRYRAQYPDPPKVSLDAALARWKIEFTTEATPNLTPTLPQYDTVCKDWRSRDKVAKFLGMFSANSVYTDWCVIEPDTDTRDSATWIYFVNKMREYYKPTENPTLKNYHFRELMQGQSETFSSFCKTHQRSHTLLLQVRECHLYCRSNSH